jgi:hypothetical protein
MAHQIISVNFSKSDSQTAGFGPAHFIAHDKQVARNSQRCEAHAENARDINCLPDKVIDFSLRMFRGWHISCRFFGSG